MASKFECNTSTSVSGKLFSGAEWHYQTFTPVIGHTGTSVKLFLKAGYGSPGTITVSIRATGSNSRPTGDDLCSGTTDGDTLTSSSEWREITFGAGTALTINTKYAYVVRAPDGDANNKITWLYDSDNPYADGGIGYSSNSGLTWNPESASQDGGFEDWGTPPCTVSSSVSMGFSVASSRAIATSRSSSATLGFAHSGWAEKNLSTYLCIASQWGGAIKTGNELGSWWNDLTGATSAYMAIFQNRLCAINNQNSGFHYSDANDITSWTNKAKYPNYPVDYTDLFVGRDAGDDPALYALTPVGMYALDVFTNFFAYPTEVNWEYDSKSGKCGFYGRGGTYATVNKGIYNINKGVVTLIGPDMDDGLPEDLQGTIYDMIQVGFWLVIAIDGGTSNKSSIMKRYITGNHWHPVYVGSADTPIRALFWDSGTLYFGEGTNVKSLPFSNATDNVAKLSTHTYAASGDIIYPYFHSEFEAMPKVAHKVRGVTQDCDSDDKITIHYRTDSTTTWTELGSFTTSPRPTALPFPASGDSIGVSFERIQHKASFARGSTTTNSPKLESLTLEYRVVPPVLWGWDFNVKALSSGDKSGKDIIDALKTALETSTLMSFYPTGSKGDTEYFVEVSEMPGNQSGTEFGEEGIYKVSVNEVID